jgi:diguanylate cyclase (GGDEF)-like protein
MTESDNTATPAEGQTEEAPASRAAILWKSAGPALMVLGSVIAVTLVARLLPMLFGDNAARMLRIVLVAAGVCLAGSMTFRHYRQWVLPAMDMRRLIHDVRVGRAPIDEFARAHAGSLHELAAELKLLLQDLRHQRQSIEDLQEEVRQRIANRTSALERTISSLRNQAARDPLTGLYNRRMLDRLLPQLIAQLQADSKSLALVMIDLDYFKMLNDTYGHAAGDELLKSIGQIISSTIRTGDFGFRYGGDEFVILLPGCEAAVAARIAERLASLVGSLGKTYKMANPPQMTSGVSTLGDIAQPTAAALLKLADDRLYEAKAKRAKPAGAADTKAA